MVKNAIDKQKVLEIVKNHLVAGLEFDIVDQRPDNFGPVYGIESWPDDVWYVYVPQKRPGVGASHYICIDKQSGEIIFDGFVGE